MALDLTGGDLPALFTLQRPLPFALYLHPERTDRLRATLVRERLVVLSTHHAPVLAGLRRIVTAPLLVDARSTYQRALDKAVAVLGLERRAQLLLHDGGPLPVQHDMGEVLAVARLAPGVIVEWAAAVETLEAALLRPVWATSLRVTIERIPALAPEAAWLVPALVRWQHLRLYEVLFGPFLDPARTLGETVPVSLDAAAATQAPGPARRPGDRGPKHGAQHQADVTLIRKTDAWFHHHVGGERVLTLAAWWHRVVREPAHAAGPADDHFDDCGCRRIVRTGLIEVTRLLRAAADAEVLPLAAPSSPPQPS
jgi:hypothetical protein